VASAALSWYASSHRTPTGHSLTARQNNSASSARRAPNTPAPANTTSTTPPPACTAAPPAPHLCTKQTTNSTQDAAGLHSGMLFPVLSDRDRMAAGRRLCAITVAVIWGIFSRERGLGIQRMRGTV
jgi:hypothetical protein